MKLFYIFLLFALPVLFFNSPLNAQNFDINTLKQINVNRNTKLDEPMKFISNSEGYIGVGVPVTVCLAAWIQHDKTLAEKGIQMSLALAANTFTTFALKRIINRDRPSITYPYLQAFESERHYSFPSGHTSNAFCDATSLSLNFKKWYVIVPAYTWACAVGYSRMHLGMHYPSDVLAGAIVGAGSAWVTYKSNKWIKHYFTERYTSNPSE